MVSGLEFTPLIAKSLKRTTLFSTGIGVEAKRRGVPSISTSTVVLSKLRLPLSTGAVISPVMSSSPLRVPLSRAVPAGRNGLTTLSGKCIIRKSSRNGLSAVESLRLPEAVMALWPSTISDVVARSVPAALVVRSRARSKSPTFCLP